MLTPHQQLLDALLQAGYADILRHITHAHRANIDAYPANLRDECILIITGDVIESKKMSTDDIYTLAIGLASLLDTQY